MKKFFKIISVNLLLICLIFIGGCKSTTTDSTELPSNNNQIVEISRDNGSTTYTSLIEVIAAVSPSVVVINATSTSFSSSGSGVIIGKSTTDDGFYYVMTCHHVIENTNYQEVVLNDGTKNVANLVGGDPLSDVAVLAIEEKNNQLSVASFVSESTKIAVGTTAIAIGNPLGTLGGTVTVGIVSSAARSIEDSNGVSRTLIQTDAAINSGNSGGALFNDQGLLMGMVNAKYAAEGVEGLGFAIPANKCYSIACDLIEKGYIEGEYQLGLTISDGYVHTGIFGSNTKVVYISAVESNSSAAGLLKSEDIIVSIDASIKSTGKTESLTSFTQASDVTSWLNSIGLAIGDTLTFTIKRGSTSASEQTVKVELVQYRYQ